LKDRNSEFRGYAAFLLGEMNDPIVVEPLIEALKDEDKRVTEMAAFSLARLTGQNLGYDQAKWKEWWEKNKSSSRDRPQ
jgi:HEAT repeat protein